MIVPAVVVGPALASTGARSTHRRSVPAAAGRRKAVKREPTVMTVTMVSTPAAHAPKHSRGAGVAPATRCGNTLLVPSASNLGAVDAATICLVNQARRADGVGALTENTRLDRAAVLHSQDMVSADYFDHVAPDGSTMEQRVLAAGYSPRAPGGEIAENIAAATGSAATPAATVASWMRSPGHRANILDPDFTRTGVGATDAVPDLLSGASGATYTEDFG
jgi:uncharacterized protein YkwD